MRRVAEPLGLTLLEAASGIHRIANARMTRALRAVSSEKGRDPRDFALIAYGGAGPIHAAGLAEDLGDANRPRARGRGPLQRRRPPLRAAGVPRGADVPPGRGRRRSRRRSRRSSPRWRPGSRTRSTGAREVEWARTADLRYGGQSWEVEVELPGRRDRHGVLAALRARFEDEHERLYGVKDQAGSPVEIRALRLAALGEAAATRSFQLDGANGAGSSGASRGSTIGGDGVDAPVRTRVVDRRDAGAGPAARRRVRHDRRRPARLVGAARRRDRDARAGADADGD